MTRRIPTTLLCGYLGSGKTTLINHLLAANHGLRVAVLVNDFGAVNIDATLIADSSDQTISLTNGCVCCSITDDLGAALEAQTTREVPPDHIVIETSGVAEPARLIHYAGAWPGVRLDSIVTMIDAETVQQRATDKFVGRVVQRQIGAADFLVLNKLDLVSSTEHHNLRDWLSLNWPEASVLETEQGLVDARILIEAAIDRHLFDPPAAAAASDATAVFATSVWETPYPVDLARFEQVLDSLPATIHRLKGYVSDAASGHLHLVQRVGRRCSITNASLTGATRVLGQIIAIGTRAEHVRWLPERLDTTRVITELGV